MSSVAHNHHHTSSTQRKQHSKQMMMMMILKKLNFTPKGDPNGTLDVNSDELIVDFRILQSITNFKIGSTHNTLSITQNDLNLMVDLWKEIVCACYNKVSCHWYAVEQLRYGFCFFCCVSFFFLISARIHRSHPV